MTLLAPDPACFIKRRKQLLAWMHRHGGGIAVLSTAPEKTRNRDSHYAYRHDSDFYYLTGFTQPNAWLVLIAGTEDQSILFCEPKHPELEIWNGLRWGPEEAAKHFCFDAAFDSGRLNDELPRLMAGHPRLMTTMSRPSDESFFGMLRGWVKQAGQQVRGARAYPTNWLDISDVLAEMRLIKDEVELATMRKAASISALAHRRAMQAVRPGCHEYELEAEILQVFRKNGAQSVAYESIVAAGPNACILHHRAGHDIMRDGDLVLIDAGCELDGYASDITRTFPANGKFSGPQRALYDIVLAAQQAAIANTSASHHFNAGHEAAVQVLTRGLLDEGLLKGTFEHALETAAYQQFYMHRTGHWLGMDVHDVGSYRTPPLSNEDQPWRMLSEGMVLTIEPGLYVRPTDEVDERFWHIGIRIEDDAIVTANGCELITRDVPVDPDEIEALIRG